MSSTDYKFQGWVGLDANAAKGQMVWQEYEPKPWAESDIDVKVTHSGICGSDIHMLSSGWSATPYPCVVGHEVLGHAVRVGKEVKYIKIGDRVGLGAQSDSCRECEECKAGREQYFPDMTTTFGGEYADGSKSY